MEDMLAAAQDLKADPDGAHLRLIKLADEAQKLEALEEQRAEEAKKAKDEEFEEVRVIGAAGDETWVKRAKNAKDRHAEIVQGAMNREFSKTKAFFWVTMAVAAIGWLIPFLTR